MTPPCRRAPVGTRAAALLAACVAVPVAPGAEMGPPPDWAPGVRAVHSRFTGTPGTFAQFGDSITETMAFWAGLPQARRNATPEMERAFRLVSAHVRPESWAGGKGPANGNQGGQTIRWALEHVDDWLRRLNPEAAVVMFGSNDLPGLPASDYRRGLRALVDRCARSGTVVLLTTIPPRHGYEARAAEYAEAARQVAREMGVPLVDFQAEVLRRRPADWDGALPEFARYDGYDVPTLIARDGVHPSYPRRYQGDYSEEALGRCGYGLRNYLTLLRLAEVIEAMKGEPPTGPAVGAGRRPRQEQAAPRRNSPADGHGLRRARRTRR